MQRFNLLRADLRRVVVPRPPRDERLQPEVQRANPLYNTPRRAFREPWQTVGNWNQDMDLVQLLIDSSPSLVELARMAMQRDTFVSPTFRGNLELTFDHLYAAMIHSRGTVIHTIKCYRCGKWKLMVFEECISEPGFANDACSSDVWHRDGGNCAKNSVRGPTVDPSVSNRTPTIALRNQSILMREIAADGHATPDQISYQPGGMIRYGRALERAANPSRTFQPMRIANDNLVEDYNSTSAPTSSTEPSVRGSTVADGFTVGSSDNRSAPPGSRGNPISLEDSPPRVRIKREREDDSGGEEHREASRRAAKRRLALWEDLDSSDDDCLSQT